MIAVTGGTGFIGSRLIHTLLQQGDTVRMLTRPRKDPVATSGAEIVWGDVRDPPAVERLVGGADLVFHLAACARAWVRDPREFETVNVEGTRNVLNAARAAGVRRVVHVSTELVDGEITPYQRTKRAGEQVVQEYVAAGGDAVIVRPTRVYGPGALNPANSVTRVMAAYRNGTFRLRLADGGAYANYVYVDDVVDGLLKAAECGERGAAYLLGGENLTIPELLNLVAEATGRRHAVLALPPLAARALGRVCELGGRLGIEPLITRDWVALLTTDRPQSSARAEAELGYRPRGARQGIAATVAWLSQARSAISHQPSAMADR
jgi:farnesol dehydrogenase